MKHYHYLTQRIYATISVYIMPEHKKQAQREIDYVVRQFIRELSEGEE